MSDDGWMKSLVGGLVILIFAVISSKGDIDNCTLCCILQGTREDLNCTWTNNSSLQFTVLLQSIPNLHDSSQNYSIPAGQNWLLIRRENVIFNHKYQLSVSGGTWKETLNLTFCHGCENVFIGAPILHSTVHEEEDDTLVVTVTWKYVKEHSHPPVVELRYRILGATDWTLVDTSYLGSNHYEMMDPEPYTVYEFQIRYIPDEHQKSRGLWSESFLLTTPEKVPVGTLDVWRDMDRENSLLVTWKPLNHHSARGRILSYHVDFVYNNTRQTTEEPCCNIALPAQSTHVCINARNSMGLGPPICVTPFCSVAADMGDFGGRAWGDPSGRVAVWWEESKNNGFPVDYVVEWRKDNSTEMDWTRSQTANQMLVLPGKFSPGIPYLISIHALYNDSCVEVFSTEAYGREEVPLAVPTYSIHVLSSSEVFMSWDAIPRHNLRGNLKHYTIYLNSTTGCEQHTVHGRNLTFSGLLPRTVYHTFITASTGAGEGVPSKSQTFQTKGARTLHPATLPLVSLICICIVVAVFFLHPHIRKAVLLVLWPKIPKPEYKLNGDTSCIKLWDSQQAPRNPPITEMELIEPISPPPPSPPRSPPPERSQAITSGYEKHFMPSPEEVMGLC